MSSGQSEGQLQESSPGWHWPLPQTMFWQLPVLKAHWAVQPSAPPPLKPWL